MIRNDMAALAAATTANSSGRTGSHWMPVTRNYPASYQNVQYVSRDASTNTLPVVMPHQTLGSQYGAAQSVISGGTRKIPSVATGVYHDPSTVSQLPPLPVISRGGYGDADNASRSSQGLVPSQNTSSEGRDKSGSSPHASGLKAFLMKFSRSSKSGRDKSEKTSAKSKDKKGASDARPARSHNQDFPRTASGHATGGQATHSVERPTPSSASKASTKTSSKTSDGSRPPSQAFAIPYMGPGHELMDAAAHVLSKLCSEGPVNLPATHGRYKEFSKDPVQPIQEYLRRLLVMTSTPREVVGVALIYLERMAKKVPKTHVGAYNIHRLTLVACLLGAKYLNDEMYDNKSWAIQGMIDVRRLNQMEVEFLNLLNYQLYVPEEELTSMWQQTAISMKKRSIGELNIPGLTAVMQAISMNSSAIA